MNKEILFAIFSSILLGCSVLAMADNQPSETTSPIKIIAAGTIVYDNAVPSVGGDSYNIQSILPISTGKSYIVLDRSMSNDNPIVLISLTSLGTNGWAGVVGYKYISSNELYVPIQDAGGTPENVPFSIQVEEVTS